MTDSPIPSVPTPPLRSKWRDLVYGIWSWGTVVLLAVIVGWAVVEEPPIYLLGVSAGWQAFGAYAGFMAKNNISGR
jgi:hypothetical protein